ncbi:MAG TPA: NAD-dependent epimerase/dehydratase family protein [Gaiellales bacterium]|nr:NAD-dependent epimerase/dehydratase family protein [Gaiellales bacterium]
MKLLVIGGTAFLGRHISEQALARGVELTLFHRGQTNPGLFPEAEHVLGDRDGGLEPLRGRRFDAVIDTSGYVPRVVRESAQLLEPSVGHYTFISTVSVYDGNGGAGTEVDGPVGTIADESVEEITEESYGPLKALCERAVEETYGPDRSLVIRPGLIVGPDDPTDRFTYWPARVAEGGRVLAPGSPSTETQIIDVRDLAGWTLDATERRLTGRFNAVGPERPLTFGHLLDRCVAVSGSDAEIVWVPSAELIARGVEIWTDLPLWLGEDPELAWMDRVDRAPAMAAGLTYRPLDDTIAETLAWHRATTGLPSRAGFRMTPERESELLAELAV